jgi:hypothetical protein
VTGIGVAGWWAYTRYIRQGENYPHIQTRAEIEFIGKADKFWIVEVRAVLENKGKVQHRFSELAFNLEGIFENDSIEVSKQWGGQVNFPHLIAKGSFLPAAFSFFLLGPGVVAKYSYLTRVPQEATFVMLHCWFRYSDGRKLGHAMEKTVQVPTFTPGGQDATGPEAKAGT